jgi:hypothetical protein
MRAIMSRAQSCAARAHCAFRAIAELQHRRGRSVIFGGGYPSFPLKEIAVCRKVYGESIEKDLDNGHFRPRSLRRSQPTIGSRREFGPIADHFKYNNSINSLFEAGEVSQRRRW